MNQTVTLLHENRPLLDEIFGPGTWHIEPSDPDGAIVRTDELQIELGFDPRDVSLGVLITHVPSGEAAIPEIWVRFLGDEIPPPSRNRRGVVTVSPADQVKEALTWLGRLVRDIFSDAETTRDAAQFVRGYTVAYNDWASRGGSWYVE